MKTVFLKFSVIVAVIMAVVTSCDKPEPDNGDQNTPKAPLVMTYQDFITPNDVQLLTSDTTSISVSKAYAEKMGITDFDDRAVTIWRTIGTVPFVRIITGSKTEKDEIILTTVKGEFCDMFENLDVSLETSLYVNRDYQPAVATRAGTNYEVDDVSSKYIDATGVYHPAVIIFSEDSPAAKSLQTKSGETKNYFTAEELIEDNFDFDVIDVHSDFNLDFAYPKDDDDNSKATKAEVEAAKLHIKGKIGLMAKLSAYARVNISWFSLKEFEAGLRGEAEIAAKVGVGVEKSIKHEWDKVLLPLGEVYSVFWIGIIPVPYSVETSIKAAVEAEAAASIALYASYKYHAGFEKGCKYTAGKGWESTSKPGESESKFKLDAIKGSATVEAEVGAFYEVAVKLGGSAGPTFAVGPKLTAEAEASAAITNKGFEVNGSAGVYIGLSGELGTKISILGYQLAKWSIGFDLFKLTLLEGEFSYIYSYSGWEEIEAGWTNALNQHSGEWEWNDDEEAGAEESVPTRVPYRLPDQEMNF